MPVRNAAPFLEEAVASILGQTFRDLELVIVDDASSDGSDAILRRLAESDVRIRLSHSAQKLGVVGAANAVVRASSAPIVARMDADDISHPERLARQVAALRARPAAVAVGSLCEGIDLLGRSIRPRDRWRLRRTTTAPPFPHGSATFLRTAFDAVGGYREECAGWEDQDFFLRLASVGEIVVLPEALYRYRFHMSSESTVMSIERGERIEAMRRKYLDLRSGNMDASAALASATAAAVDTGDRVRALRYLGGMRIWSGQRAGVFRYLLNARATLRTLLWAAWASLHPRSLVALSRSVIRLRDLVAGFRFRDGKAYAWRFD